MSEKFIDVLTSEEFSDKNLLLLDKFEEYAKQYGGDLSDDESFLIPTYPDFEDFDKEHDASIVNPIYLNDYDFYLTEDREKVANLLRKVFDKDTYDTIATCDPNCNNLRGNYLIGSKISCNKCGNYVTRKTLNEIIPEAWIRCPTGVDRFINPGIYRTFLRNFKTQTPVIEIFTYLLDDKYRREMKRERTNGALSIDKEIKSIGMGYGINEVYKHFEEFIGNLLNNNTKHLRCNISKNARLRAEYTEFYLKYKDVIFCKYIPCSNSLLSIIEKNGNYNYLNTKQLKVNEVYQSIADTKDAIYNEDGMPLILPEDIQENIDIVLRNIVLLSTLKSANLKDELFAKKGKIRRSVISGTIALSGRNIITSITGVHNQNKVVVPWIMAIPILELHILNHLYRNGYSPKKASELFHKTYYERTPIIDNFLYQHEKNHDILGQLGRHPSIQYLSARTFFIEINRDLEDESLRLPILTASPFCAKIIGPLDEKSLMRILFNCWNPLKLICLSII